MGCVLTGEIKKVRLFHHIIIRPAIIVQQYSLRRVMRFVKQLPMVWICSDRRDWTNLWVELKPDRNLHLCRNHCWGHISRDANLTQEFFGWIRTRILHAEPVPFQFVNIDIDRRTVIVMDAIVTSVADLGAQENDKNGYGGDDGDNGQD